MWRGGAVNNGISRERWGGGRAGVHLPPGRSQISADVRAEMESLTSARLNRNDTLEQNKLRKAGVQQTCGCFIFVRRRKSLNVFASTRSPLSPRSILTSSQSSPRWCSWSGTNQWRGDARRRGRGTISDSRCSWLGRHQHFWLKWTIPR